METIDGVLENGTAYELEAYTQIHITLYNGDDAVANISIESHDGKVYLHVLNDPNLGEQHITSTVIPLKIGA